MKRSSAVSERLGLQLSSSLVGWCSSFYFTHSLIEFLEAAGFWGHSEISSDWIFKTVFKDLPSSNMTFCDSTFLCRTISVEKMSGDSCYFLRMPDKALRLEPQLHMKHRLNQLLLCHRLAETVTCQKICTTQFDISVH